MENKYFPFKRLNIIDKEFLDALKPMIFIQNFLLFPTFSVTDRTVTSIMRNRFLKCCVGAVFFVLMRVYRTVCVLYFGKLSAVLIGINLIVGCFGTIFTYTVNIIQSENIVLLLLNLQYALRNINWDKHAILTHHKFWNYINVIGVFTGYIIYTILIAIVNQETYFGGSFLVSYYVSVIFDINMIFVTRTVALMANVLAAWNRKLISLQKVLAEESYGNCSDVMFSAYEKIIKAFGLCKNVYQFAISYHTLQTFHQVLHSMQQLIDYGKSAAKEEFRMFGLLRFMVHFAWNCKNFMLLVNLSVACERFDSRVSDVETTCVQLIAAHEKPGLRKTCKNVLRLNRASLRRLSACGLFSVGAPLPLRVGGAVAPYTVVLLQFALA